VSDAALSLSDEASISAALREALDARGDVPGWDDVWFVPSAWVERGPGFAIATNRLRRWEEHRATAPGPLALRPVTVWQRALVCAADSAEETSVDVSRFKVAGWR
jgi:hypothetical protein